MDWTQIVAVTVPVMTAMAGGFWVWLQGRPKSRLDAQGAITGGFQVLITQLQADRAALLIERAQEKADRQIERKQLLEEIGQLKLEVSRLSRRIIKMERTIREHGLEPPPAEGEMPPE